MLPAAPLRRRSRLHPLPLFRDHRPFSTLVLRHTSGPGCDGSVARCRSGFRGADPSHFIRKKS